MSAADGLKGRDVVEKMSALCQAVLDGDQFREANKKLEAFLADEDSKKTYAEVSRRRADIAQRESRGFALTAGEALEVDKLEKTLTKNPLIRGFFEASQEMEKIKLGVVTYLEKTFEICQVPTRKDFEEDETSSTK